jgi:omega-6 fatty acid desaturase (delta-12 desaturase)
MSCSSRLSGHELDLALRETLRPHRVRSTAWGVGIAALDLSLYLTFGALALRYANTWVGVFFGLLAGIAVGMLFLTGHDACHGSLTSSPTLNAWLGRIVFLPSLTPFSMWDAEHNRTHHRYTNLKTRDYVWAPFSKEEYEQLPAWRRALEGLYRSIAGVGLYYAIEIWWRKLLFPKSFERHVEVVDCILCVGAGGCAIAAVGYGYGWRGVLVGLAVPFVVWTQVMGWAIFEHHTHPAVPWYDDEQRWRTERAQSRCAVHIVLPPPVDAVFHAIFQHTAHHLDVTIPLYRLRSAQHEAELASSGEVVVYRWTPWTFARHLRQCRLYDFKAQRWLDFDGTPSCE